MEEPKKKIGKRQEITTLALGHACDQVIKVLNDKSMQQCFPNADRAVLKDARVRLVESFKTFVPAAWEDHAKEFDLENKLDSFDKLYTEARERELRNEPPASLYAIAGDGNITIPSATVPILKSATEELRQKRLALSQENTATYERIAGATNSTNNSEAQIRKILADFRKVYEDIGAVDDKEIGRLQARMLEVVGQDL